MDFKNNKRKYWLSSSFEAWTLHSKKIQYGGSNTLVQVETQFLVTNF